MARGGFEPAELDRDDDAVAATDWSQTATVAVVEFLPATSARFEDDRWRTEVYRYEGPAPPASVYDTGERLSRVRQVTEPPAERLRTTE